MTSSKGVLFSLCVVVLSLFWHPTFAHEVRPTFLLLTQTGDKDFSVLWKVPARGDAVLKLRLELPEVCVDASPKTHVRDTASVVQRWRVQCSESIAGKRVRVAGLETTAVEMIARVEWQGRSSQNVRLSGGENEFQLSEQVSFLSVVNSYLPFGMTHILEGWDHLLFLVALMLLVRSTGQVLLAVTSFTAAHSVTLALAVLGVVHVPSGLVETFIAMSIVFMAVEALRKLNGVETMTTRKPWLVSFAFGLLHGLGFAGALSDAGLPQDAVVSALLFFNIGVELGQIVFVVLFMGGLWAIRLIAEQDRVARQGALYIAGIAGAFWTFERVFALFGLASA